MTLTILFSLFVAGYLLTFILDPFRDRNPYWKESKIFVLASLVLGLALGFLVAGVLDLVWSSFWILGLTVFALEYTLFDLAGAEKNRRLARGKKRMVIDFEWKPQAELAESKPKTEAQEINELTELVAEPKESTNGLMEDRSMKEGLEATKSNREFLTEKKIKDCSLTHNSPPFLIKTESFGEKGPGL